jgi:hypothetical protein
MVPACRRDQAQGDTPSSTHCEKLDMSHASKVALGAYGQHRRYPPDEPYLRILTSYPLR